MLPSRKVHRLTWSEGRSLELGRHTRVMGILNLTPDSFSDGGRFARAAGDGPDVDAVVRAAERMLEDGANVLDFGGESTRPGAVETEADEEIARIEPSLRAVRSRFPDAALSVDTRKAAVAEAALDAGADWINDVSAAADPAMAPLAATRGAPLILMHMRGTPETMQEDVDYDDLLGTIGRNLIECAHAAENAGVSSDNILLDPGIGFGKSAAGNLAVLRDIPKLASAGYPLLVGASRKRFLGAVLDLPTEERLEGSLAAAAIAAWQGVHVVRVHDVKETVRTVRVVDAIRDD